MAVKKFYEIVMNGNKQDGGEVVSVYTKSGKLISRAVWSPSGEYTRVQI